MDGDTMRVKYIIEYARGSWTPPVQKPVGVWAFGGGRLVAKYRIGEGQRQKRADAGIALAVKQGKIPDDVLDYKVRSSSPYTTIFTDPIETADFKTPEECAEKILTQTLIQYRLEQEQDVA